MRVVLGLSLTAGSAVWVLVDTYDGSIIADEVVALDSVNELARAAARSVQTFALQSDRDIDGVRLVWDDDDAAARQHGIRLRTKLRLFGFDTVETVSEEAAREGRNRTARHIAPHMVLAYGAARADVEDTGGAGVLRRLVARVPRHVPPVTMSVRLAAAATVAAIAVVGVVLYAFVGGSPSHEVPDNAVAEAVLPAPPAAVPAAPVPAPVPAAAQAAPLPEPVPEALPEIATTPEDTWIPDVVDAEIAATPAAEPVAEVIEAPEVAVVHGLDPAAPQAVSAVTGVPHLSGAGPVAGPVAQAVPAPAAPVAPAPPAPAGPLGALFRALP